MRPTAFITAAAILAVILPAGVSASDRGLTFNDRVALEERIQRVSYAHRVGTDKPFDGAVSRDVLEQRVRDVLERRAILEEVWGREITSDALQRETLRVVNQTQMPGRLNELFAELDDDPILIQEGLVLPALVRRLSQRLFDSDPRIREKSWHEWAWQVLPKIDLDNRPVVADDTLDIAAFRARLRNTSQGPEEKRNACVPGADDVWAAGGSLNEMLQTDFAAAVWTGTEVILWGGHMDRYNRSVNTGGRYDPVLDSWIEISTIGAPESRYDHTAVWTGTEMIVWGGRPAFYQSGVATGGRYDPATDTWTPVNTVDAPLGRARHSAIWTGTEMIVWGGSTPWDVPDNTGGRYDPVSDSWTATSTVDAPEPRTQHSTVWTGSKMIVWGGHDDSVPTEARNTGGIYDPTLDTWTATTTVKAPSTRYDHTAVWTGTEMIVYGGRTRQDSWYANGSGYDPATDQWKAVASNGDRPRVRHSAVWTGSEMLITGYAMSTGDRYDPASNTWQALPHVNAPYRGFQKPAHVWTGTEWIVWARGFHRYDPAQDVWFKAPGPNGFVGRIDHTAVWTGNEMIVWGGRWSDTNPNSVPLDSGFRYDPILDSWTATNSNGAPAGSYGHTAVWTGSEKIVFGGIGGAGSGARYDPLTDQWTPVSTVGAPVEERWRSSAVWTGAEMVVWGGAEVTQSFDTGARYDPAMDMWQTMSTTDAPTGRLGHTAVWTGSEMIVWGGFSYSSSSSPFDSGARYDPVTDSWTATERLGAPSGRHQHSAVWTGVEMIVWGGSRSGPSLDSGGRYDPVSNGWSPTEMTGAPMARAEHSAVWTGAEMIVWGGESSSTGTSTGARYRPLTGMWSPTSLSDDRPGNRWEHSALWTGESMLVWGGRRGGNALIPGLHTGGSYDATVDRDADGTTDSCDCAPTDGTVFDEPGEITGLRWLADKTTLEWDSAAPGSGTGTTYDVMRGESTGLPVGGGAGEICLESPSADPSAEDLSAPAAGAVRYYLVRGANTCGVGTYGSESSGAPRVSSVCP